MSWDCEGDRTTHVSCRDRPCGRCFESGGGVHQGVPCAKAEFIRRSDECACECRCGGPQDARADVRCSKGGQFPTCLARKGSWGGWWRSTLGARCHPSPRTVALQLAVKHRHGG